MDYISRRDLLKRAGAASAAAAVPPRSAKPRRQPAAPPRAEPLETLTQPRGDTLEAIAARLIPTDANGPGAAEARAAHYIDRALGGALAPSREAYRSGARRLDTDARAVRRARRSRSCPRRSGRRAAATWSATSPPASRRRCRVLQPRARAHAPGHVLRSVLRRQRELRRAGICIGYPGVRLAVTAGRAAPRPSARRRRTCRRTTTRCSPARPARASPDTTWRTHGD